jgi:hypothetical protein
MPLIIGRPGTSAYTIVSQQRQAILTAPSWPPPNLAPGEQLIDIGVVLAGDARNCGVKQPRLGRYSQLALLGMTLAN